MLKEINSKNSIYRIAREISVSDKEVLEEVSDCILNTKKYFIANQENFIDRDVEYSDGKEVVQWLGMVNILQKHKYICECDWKEDSETFFEAIHELKGVISNNLPFEKGWFSENQKITDWFCIIDNKWKLQNMCIAAIDIESDSYILFPCRLNVLEILKENAEKMDFEIMHACDM